MAVPYAFVDMDVRFTCSAERAAFQVLHTTSFAACRASGQHLPFTISLGRLDAALVVSLMALSFLGLGAGGVE